MSEIAKIIEALGQRLVFAIVVAVFVLLMVLTFGGLLIVNKAIDKGYGFETGTTKLMVPFKPEPKVPS